MPDKLDETNKIKPVILSPEDVYKIRNVIDSIVNEIIIDQNYNVSDIKPNEWNFILYTIGCDYFRIHPELIRKYNISDNSYNNSDYIYNNISLIYDFVYKYLCTKYKQMITLEDIQTMLWITNNTMFRNGIGNYNKGIVSKDNIVLRKKIMQDAEVSLKNAMLSSSGNPIKYIAIGNNRFNWSERQKEEIEEINPVLSLDDIPDVPLLELSDSLTLPDFGDDP